MTLQQVEDIRKATDTDETDTLLTLLKQRVVTNDFDTYLPVFCVEYQFDNIIRGFTKRQGQTYDLVFVPSLYSWIPYQPPVG